MDVLHAMNQTRLAFIRESVLRHAGLPDEVVRHFEGNSVLDIGCGGGLLAECLSRSGAAVLGIDPCKEAIAQATSHACSLPITYRCLSAEDLLSETQQRFDYVFLMEVLEHTDRFEKLLSTALSLLRSDDGMLFVSTINRTIKSWFYAKLMAEYVTRLLPVGTHDWNSFVAPYELRQCCLKQGYDFIKLSGMKYAPLSKRWSICHDVSTNYIVSIARKGILQD